MTDKREDIIIFIKKRPDWFIMIGTGLWAIFTPILVITEIFQYFNGSIQTVRTEEIIGWILYVIAEIFCLRVFLWHFRGQEKIVLTKEILRIEKKGTILNFPDNYRLEKIRDFSLAENKLIENMFNFYKLTGGKIQFVYFGETIKFGQSLTQMEARKIIQQLNEGK